MTDTPPMTGPDAAPPGARGRIRNYFLTGLVVAGPVAITFWLIWSFVTWVDDLIRPFFPVWMLPENYLRVKVPGLGLIIAFLGLTLLGFLTANFIGRKFVGFGEMLLERMPIVRPLYRGLKQVFETLFSKSGSSFREVGLIEFPSAGMWSLVFLSSPPSAEINAVLPGEDYVSVFMPCTPNPTTGFFIYVLRKDVIKLDVPVESAAKLIMTAGMIQPTADPARAMATIAEQARAAKTMRTVMPAK